MQFSHTCPGRLDVHMYRLCIVVCCIRITWHGQYVCTYIIIVDQNNQTINLILIGWGVALYQARFDIVKYSVMYVFVLIKEPV